MKIRNFYAVSIVLIMVVACGTPSFPAPDPTAVSTFTSVPTDAPTATLETPLSSQSLTLTSIPFSESKDGPVYALTAQIPQLQGSDDPRVAAFNARLNELVQNEIDRFRQDILANQPVAPIAFGNAFDMTYALIGQRGDVWSIKFDAYFNYDGAAHPGSYSVALNYDLAQGRELALDDLFLHGVNHLQTIADYCKAELSTRDIAFEMFQDGANPTPVNYRNWNLSDEGLVIAFDAYQVAPYAAGPQIVVIPYAELMRLASPQSALRFFNP
ncbi:MAG: DUF3298 domain-containing protein [Anaerolineales bacterium]|nr:DUF3298 domain-containing protein [Anaerolineales bacterium]